MRLGNDSEVWASQMGADVGLGCTAALTVLLRDLCWRAAKLGSAVVVLGPGQPLFVAGFEKGLIDWAWTA